MFSHFVLFFMKLAFPLPRAILLLLSFACLPLHVSAESASHDYVLLEFLDAAPRQQASFEAWWPTHVQAVLDLPGVQSAQKHVLAAVKLKRPSTVALPAHLAIYTIRTQDIAGIERQWKGRVSALDTRVDASSARIYLYQLTGRWNSKTPTPSGDFYRQLVFASALPGREAEFDLWYDKTHAADLVTVPGVTEVRRLRFVRNWIGPEDSPPYSISMMDFKTDSFERFSDVLDEMGTRFINSEAFDKAGAWRFLFTVEALQIAQ